MTANDQTFAGFREQIPALRHGTYLNTGGIGPSPQPVTDVLVRLAQEIGELGPDGMAFSLEEFTHAEAVRAKLAAFVGADAAELSLLRSTAEGFNAIGHGLRWREGDEVVFGVDDHPAARAVWAILARRYGIRPVPVELPDGDETAIVEAVRAQITPRTRLISLSHVNSEHGLRVPAQDLAALAHSAGALLMLDGCQAVGQFPIDLHSLDCDFYAAGTYKWLLAPFGTAFLYARQALLTTIEPSWGGASKAVRFDPAQGYWDAAPTGEKFEFGARYWPLVRAMGAAVDFVGQAGTARIVERSRALVETLSNRLRGRPGVVDFTPSCASMRTGMAGVAVDGLAGAALAERLRASGVHVRANRGPNGLTGVRLCLAFFTTDTEVDSTAKLIARIAQDVA